MKKGVTAYKFKRKSGIFREKGIPSEDAIKTINEQMTRIER